MEKAPINPEKKEDIIDIIDRKIKEGVINNEEQEKLDKFYKENSQYGLNTEKEETEKELKLEKEAEEIKSEIEKTPPREKEKIGWGLRNLGFFVQEWKSGRMADICEKVVPKESKSSIGRFLVSLAETYRKDESAARKKIEEREKSAGVMKRMQNSGYLMGNIMKYGRTIADVVGWTAGSPLRYVMLGAQFFSRGAEAAKEARFKNEEVVEKTRVRDIDEAAEEAWKIYETAKEKSSDGKVSQDSLEKAYAENLPQDLLKRLERTEPGTAGGILSKIIQKILQKDVEFAVKHGKFSKASFENRLKEFDKMVGHYGTVDALAMAAKYAETGGKAVIAGVQIESALLLIKKLPEIFASIDGGGAGTGTKVFPEAKSTLESGPRISVESVVEVKKGDTVWKLAEKQLEERGYFKNLSGSADEIAAKKNFLIDSISKKVEVPSGNANLIHAGEKIDFKNIFSDESKIEQFVDKAEHLKPKAAVESGKKVFDYFEHQDRPEKWRTIQIYQHDIDSMKENLAKFEDPQVKASIQKEIDRLEGVKTSLIKKLAEQTEQMPEGKEETIANILPKEKENFLDYIAKEYPRNVKVEISDEALEIMREKGIVFKDGKLIAPRDIALGGGKSTLSFDSSNGVETKIIDIHKSGGNLEISVTNSDNTIDKVIIKPSGIAENVKTK